MSQITKLINPQNSALSRLIKINIISRNASSYNSQEKSQNNAQTQGASSSDQQYSNSEDEFRIFNVRKIKSQQRIKKKQMEYQKLKPRTQQMEVDQDWGSVWTGPRSFHPATVPLPIRQGYTVKGAPPPDKYANAELMKIPNFLHLTPPVIRRQCEAIKKFCTPWPATGLETETKMKTHFPINVITSDYCHGLPTIRNPLARIVTIQLPLSSLALDKHAKDKLLRIVGERYNPETDLLTIVTDRCPVRKQNLDYAQYLLTAIYHESWITEPWENTTKTVADMEYYDWNLNVSKTHTESILNFKKDIKYDDNELDKMTKEFSKSVETLMNEGENQINIQKYKAEVIKLLNLTPLKGN